MKKNPVVGRRFKPFFLGDSDSESVKRIPDLDGITGIYASGERHDNPGQAANLLPEEFEVFSRRYGLQAKQFLGSH